MSCSGSNSSSSSSSSSLFSLFFFLASFERSARAPRRLLLAHPGPGPAAVAGQEGSRGPELGGERRRRRRAAAVAAALPLRQRPLGCPRRPPPPVAVVEIEAGVVARLLKRVGEGRVEVRGGGAGAVAAFWRDDDAKRR